MGVDRRVVLDPVAGAGRELSWTLTPGGTAQPDACGSDPGK